jgi:hypothetical protein
VCVRVLVRMCVRVSIKHFLVYVITFEVIHLERKGSPSVGGVLIQVWF